MINNDLTDFESCQKSNQYENDKIDNFVSFLHILTAQSDVKVIKKRPN